MPGEGGTGRTMTNGVEVFLDALSPEVRELDSAVRNVVRASPVKGVVAA
jgi:hypothetical protein